MDKIHFPNVRVYLCVFVRDPFSPIFLYVMNDSPILCYLFNKIFLIQFLPPVILHCHALSCYHSHEFPLNPLPSNNQFLRMHPVYNDSLSFRQSLLKYEDHIKQVTVVHNYQTGK